jgi:F420-non-reducing hydrogenase iron-sulfur subunit
MAFEPKIVCLLCRWCAYAGADLAGTNRLKYKPNGIIIRVMCTGRIDPQHILWAFSQGADGVLVAGCHPGECHYQMGNVRVERRVCLLRRVMAAMGIEADRLHLTWVSAAEGKKFVQEVNNFIERIRALGPIR